MASDKSMISIGIINSDLADYTKKWYGDGKTDNLLMYLGVPGQNNLYACLCQNPKNPESEKIGAVPHRSGYHHIEISISNDMYLMEKWVKKFYDRSINQNSDISNYNLTIYVYRIRLKVILFIFRVDCVMCRWMHT